MKKREFEGDDNTVKSPGKKSSQESSLSLNALADGAANIQKEYQVTEGEEEYNSALRHYNGTGVEKNLPEAARLYKIASDKGNAQATLDLGKLYHLGLGVDKNLVEAARLYKIASDKGLLEATFNLGYCYQHGIGVEKNLSEAVRLYKIASDKGHAEATHNLGLCYQHGIGVEKNLPEAARLYEIASDKGNTKATCNLGNLYYLGLGVEKNLLEAFRLTKIASDKGDTKATNNLGKLYHLGLGVEKNLSEAARLYKIASDKGLLEAALNLDKLVKKTSTSLLMIPNKITELKRVLNHVSQSLGYGDNATQDLEKMNSSKSAFATVGFIASYINSIDGNIALGTTLASNVTICEKALKDMLQNSDDPEVTKFLNQR